MQATPETLSLLTNYLSSTVSPDAHTRRSAEESLRQAEGQQGFLLLVLELVKADSVNMVVRQAGGVYFKNTVKRLWSGDEVCPRPAFQSCLVSATFIDWIRFLRRHKLIRLTRQPLNHNLSL